MNVPTISQALKMWEKAITLIKRREKILAKLEIFERAASDPNRFFHRGKLWWVYAAFANLLKSGRRLAGEALPSVAQHL